MLSNTKLSNYLNKKFSLRSLSDQEFEKILPELASELELHGIISTVYTNEQIKMDWELLLKKDATLSPLTSSATEIAGMKVMRKHMSHFHNVCNYKGTSVASLWTKIHLEKALRFNRAQHSTPYMSEIIRSISFTNGLGKVTMYRPCMAKKIVTFLATQLKSKNVRVLDVCAGWGGRMIGAKSVGNDITVHYTGIEPCEKTYHSLCAIRTELSLTNVTLIQGQAEIVLQTHVDQHDIALTSPPYYNLEIYSNESTQSVGTGMSYEEWLEAFLKPVIQQIIKTGVKYSCWSVKNFKSDKKYNLFDDVVNIHDKHGWTLLEDSIFRMVNSKRPGFKSASETKKTEECTYVFVPK